jgi:hypothetical protein
VTAKGSTTLNTYFTCAECGGPGFVTPECLAYLPNDEDHDPETLLCERCFSSRYVFIRWSGPYLKVRKRAA